GAARQGSGAPRLGTRAPSRRVQLLLVPEGPRRQLQRVLRRPRLHRRRRAVDATRVGRAEEPLQLGTAGAGVLPGAGRPGRDDAAATRLRTCVRPRYDVVIVGYGPVGQLLAILLAQRGWRVGVFEKQPVAYPLPRAVHFDHEVARILQAA